MYTFTHVSHTMALGQLKRDVATKVDANCVMNHTVASAIETTIAYLEKNNRKQQRTTHPIIRRKNIVTYAQEFEHSLFANMASSLSALCHESLLRTHLEDDPYITEAEHLEALRGNFCSRGYGVLFECADDILVAQAKAAYWRMSEIKLEVMSCEGCRCGNLSRRRP